MKLPALCSLFALATLGVTHAGSFGGPGPFNNLSPLQSGIDGSYQAIARGENLTGIIRFAYQNGVQTSVAGANTYVFFVNGNVVSGSSTVAITGKELAGVLGGQDFTIPTNEEGGSELPLIFVVRGNRANGFFNGRMDLEDRMSFFSGDGQITGAPNETNTLVYIPDISVNATGSAIIDLGELVDVVEIEIPGGSIEADPNATTVAFDFEGVRSSVVPQGSFVGTGQGGTGAAARN